MFEKKLACPRIRTCHIVPLLLVKHQGKLWNCSKQQYKCLIDTFVPLFKHTFKPVPIFGKAISLCLHFFPAPTVIQTNHFSRYLNIQFLFLLSHSTRIQIPTKQRSQPQRRRHHHEQQGGTNSWESDFTLPTFFPAPTVIQTKHFSRYLNVNFLFLLSHSTRMVN